jgi:hypothetical protein
VNVRCHPLRLFLVAALALVAAAAPAELRAWGSGHDDIMRAVIERLPPGLRDRLTPEVIDEAVKHASHYPDSFEPFLPEEIGETGVATLTAAGIKVRYDLHSERGMAMTFIMLVEAIRDDKPARIAHWIATLSHVIADMAACNHDPVVHTATYGWADWNLKLPDGQAFATLKPLLDLSGPVRNLPGGGDAFAAAIDSQRLPDDGRDAAAALVDVMLYGQEGAAYCSARGVGILEGAVGWITRRDDASRDLLGKNIGELGAWAVVRTLRDFEAATRLAASGEKLTITPEITAAYESGVARRLKERQLGDEALFAPILREPDPAETADYGIVLEPSWAMNGAMFGFASRVLSVAIARTLRDAGETYATLDVRRLLDEGFPPPSQVAEVIIVASSFHRYHTLDASVFDAKLSDYLARGGRVLWIMGNTQPAATSLAPFRAALRRDDAKSQLPLSDGQFLGARLTLVNSPLPPLTIARPARTAAGWQQPFCGWTYDREKMSDLQPLATLASDSDSLIVGAISPDRRIACLPVYSLTPYLFGGIETIESPHHPALDAATAALLFDVLKRQR